MTDYQLSERVWWFHRDWCGPSEVIGRLTRVPHPRLLESKASPLRSRQGARSGDGRRLSEIEQSSAIRSGYSSSSERDWVRSRWPDYAGPLEMQMHVQAEQDAEEITITVLKTLTYTHSIGLNSLSNDSMNDKMARAILQFHSYFRLSERPLLYQIQINYRSEFELVTSSRRWNEPMRCGVWIPNRKKWNITCWWSEIRMKLQYGTSHSTIEIKKRYFIHIYKTVKRANLKLSLTDFSNS